MHGGIGLRMLPAPAAWCGRPRLERIGELEMAQAGRESRRVHEAIRFRGTDFNGKGGARFDSIVFREKIPTNLPSTESR